ncbi:hypothetical protein UR09_03735 [Candidatus Nitromaritima sp. SCGC AAA799-A02]|nr:hypothetical protein UR09_03735 [Candidatus Nitromaritima sp. SCGC AAA799-A02]KMP12184.1 hypothetical protein UZ36_01840 [Candidatus Nitromaritima sp. SCGC AAA799-C22]
MSSEYGEKKVLVADNSPVMAHIIKSNLVALGFDEEKVITANDGEHAFMMLEVASFQLVTTGIHMKVKDGFELIREVRASDQEGSPAARIIVVTSERDPATIEQLEKAKINAYLSKPFTASQLGDTISKIFKNEETLTSIEMISTSASDVPESKLDIDFGIIQAFVDSTVDSMGQYMVSAVPGEPVAYDEFDGYFSSSLDLTNADQNIRMLLALNFPKDVACKIYEGIFGEVDMDQVCGVVQELVNIIGGIVKPKIDEFSAEIISLVHPGRKPPDKLSWDLGLPCAQMGEGHTFNIGKESDPKFIVPFQVNNEKFDLVVVFQKT